MEREQWVTAMQILGITRSKVMSMSKDEFESTKSFAIEAGLKPSIKSHNGRNNNVKSRSIISEQNNEYEKAELEQLMKQENEEKQRLKDIETIKEMKMRINEYSTLGEDEANRIKVLIKMPNNKKLIKRFNSRTISEDLYHCALCDKDMWNDNGIEKGIILRDPLGRALNKCETLRSLGITKNTVITVEYK